MITASIELTILWLKVAIAVCFVLVKKQVFIMQPLQQDIAMCGQCSDEQKTTKIQPTPNNAACLKLVPAGQFKHSTLLSTIWTSWVARVVAKGTRSSLLQLEKSGFRRGTRQYFYFFASVHGCTGILQQTCSALPDQENLASHSTLEIPGLANEDTHEVKQVMPPGRGIIKDIVSLILYLITQKPFTIK